MLKNILFFCILLMVVGCQTPTKVTERSEARFSYLVRKNSEPILIDSKTIVLDSRPKFDYMMYSVPGAIHILWQEFLQDQVTSNQIASGDKAFSIARRLARMGLSVDSDIVVIGRNEPGQKNSGRLAWSLLNWGFKKVQVVSVSRLYKMMSPFQERKHKSLPIWKPNVEKENLELSLGELRLGIKKTNTHLVLFVDEKNQLKGNCSKFSLEVMCAEVGLQSFYNEKGRPELAGSLRKIIASKGQGKDIYLVSSNGVASAAAGFSLVSQGVLNVRNFSGKISDIKK